MSSCFRSCRRVSRTILIIIVVLLLIAFLSPQHREQLLGTIRGKGLAPYNPHCYSKNPESQKLCQQRFPPTHPSQKQIHKDDVYVEELKLTKIPDEVSTYGFTLFDNLYLKDGKLYVLTNDRRSFPRLPHILSKPLVKKPGVSTSPTSSEMQFIRPEQANGILGDHIMRLTGFTVLVYDPQQFMDHYYHWWGEIILGLWRVYSKLGLQQDGTIARLPFPTRFMIPFVEESGWRDRASVNGPLMRAAFPEAIIESGHGWQDLIELDTPVVFSRVLLVNREAAHKHPLGSKWYKMTAGTMDLPIPPEFWTPIRDSLLKNLLGPQNTPLLDPQSRAVLSPEKYQTTMPVLTYVSRQNPKNSFRRIKEEDHDILVEELMKLEMQGFCEVNVVRMEDMTIRAQIELAARTTIMLGVHGNGLTHELWMEPSPKSTVIEMFVPGGYVYDYEILARNLGHKHYAVWNDTYVTYPKGVTHEGIKYPPGFHGTDIPVWAETVADIVRQRLSGAE